VFAWLHPDRAERGALLPAFFDVFADVFARHDETALASVDGSVAGVAMWAPPGVAPVHPDDAEAMGTRLVELIPESAERLGIIDEAFAAAHPEDPVWYLQFVGVDPVHQSQGIGSTLLRDVLDAADRGGHAAYLDATSPSNRALYERHGFVVVAEHRLPDGPPAWSMLRESR
jgi:ribosomal protein S18 acetylase RimI-like enzyme